MPPARSGGTWKAVNIWESKEAYEAFRDERIVPAVKTALGDDFAAAGPPPDEWFETKRMLGG